MSATISAPSSVATPRPVRATRAELLSIVLDPSRLPTPPAVALQVVNAASRPDCDPGEIVALIGLDASLCAKLLKAVNSCLYGLKQPVASVGRAVHVLGLKTVRSLALRLYDRGKLFVKKAGTIILGVTFLVWVLSVLPIHSGQFADLATSVIGRLGHWIEPVIRPLGFNWKIGIGLLSSIVAREVIVGTLGTLYGMDPATHAEGLQAALRHDMTLGGAIALVVFFAFAMQCTSTLAVVRRETNSWKLPALQFAYMTMVAYVAALVTNQVIVHLF